MVEFRKSFLYCCHCWHPALHHVAWNSPIWIDWTVGICYKLLSIVESHLSSKIQRTFTILNVCYTQKWILAIETSHLWLVHSFKSAFNYTYTVYTVLMTTTTPILLLHSVSHCLPFFYSFSVLVCCFQKQKLFLKTHFIFSVSLSFSFL